MNVVLGSAFRNSARPHVARYMAQAAALRDALGPAHGFRVRAVEGDSTNDTPGLLRAEAAMRLVPLDLATCAHGGPVFGSTEDPARMAALSGVGNAILDGVTDRDDVLVYVESDLIWQPTTMLRLAAQLGPGRDVMAPMPFAGDHFYDVWAFRVNGTRFGPFAPYYHQLRLDQPTPVDSVGSCLVMRAEVARRVRMTDGAIVQFCANARAQGYQIFCDARERVSHPC